ncbi:MAG TPA: HAD-IC family P-type ATPase, partial [Hyphomicrobiaceae bacterium]|nr:HAD-IC family P-type ATPase [Hyphomicrobiaceae bacterium]
VNRQALARAAALAATSRHPYARAVVRAANSAGLAVRPVENVREVPGQGLEVVMRSAASTVTGSDPSAASLDLEGDRPGEGPDPVPPVTERLGSAAWCGVLATEDDAAPVWYRGRDGAIVGLYFEDKLRSDAAEVVRRLHAARIATELLSGDRSAAVEAAAKASAISNHKAGQMPADKIARLELLKRAGRKVLMVGDGLNDAPALAAAHASMSPASAADISQTAADAVVQGERLEPVLETIAVARAARRMALQNFTVALGYNCVFVPLAVAGYVTPLIAAIAMSASSIAVTANAVRLKTKRLDLT